MGEALLFRLRADTSRSKGGPIQRVLHIIAGVIFGSLAVGIVLKIAGRW
jgi:hypothetical protein